MQMNNKTYDTLKWLVQIVSPAFIVLIETLGALYGYETTVITGTIAGITVFVGAVLGISNNNFHKTHEIVEKEELPK